MADDLLPGATTVSLHIWHLLYQTKKGVLHQADTPREMVPASTKLRRLLNKPNHLVVCPGVYDGFSARVALEIGFDAMYMVSCSSS